jgi:hypothetical protein
VTTQRGKGATTEHHWPSPTVGPWTVTLKWQRVDGRPECVGVAIATAFPEVLVTASILRKLPLADWIAEDRSALAPQVPAIGGLRKSTAERLTAVAKLYEQAVQDGKPPTKAVAEHYGITPGGAANLVSRARAHGLLPPTSPGVATAFGRARKQEFESIRKMRPGPERQAAIAATEERWEEIDRALNQLDEDQAG